MQCLQTPTLHHIHSVIVSVCAAFFPVQPVFLSNTCDAPSPVNISLYTFQYVLPRNMGILIYNHNADVKIGKLTLKQCCLTVCGPYLDLGFCLGAALCLLEDLGSHSYPVS